MKFSERTSLIEYIQEYKNLVVIRTMSKAFGIAAAKCGFVFGNKKLIKNFKTIIITKKA